MTNLLRNLTVGSFVLVILTLFSVGMYYRMVVENRILIATTEDNNTAVAYGYTSSVWKKNATNIQKLKSASPLSQKRFLRSLKAETDNYFKPLELVKYAIYYPNGEDILTGKRFGSDPKNSGESEKAMLNAQYGNVKTTIIEEYNHFSTYYTVAQTFYPIILKDQSGGNIQGIIEIVYDITPVWQDPLKIQFIALGIITALLTAFYGIMIYSSKKAEQIISKQHEVALDLTTAKASAEEESEAKSKFLANISHELRTPLNAIIGFSEILKDEALGAIGNDQYKDYVKDIHSSGVHLLSLINDILDFSKAEAGKLEMEMKDVDITKVMKASMRLVSPRAQEAGVQLIEKIPKEHLVIKTDAKRLKQVLLNLLSNAVKFTPQGGSVTLLAWSGVAEGKLVIEVQDTGVGIKAKDISKVMATFGQAENKLSRQYEGTGLGLPLSKKLIELMDGSFDIRSKEGEGTTVTITLPQFEEKQQDATS